MLLFSMHASAWRRLAACATVALSLAASDATAQSLDSLVRLAQQTHPTIEAARLASRSADARARAAEAWEPPSVGLELGDLPLTDPNPFARGETMLMVEQMVPLFGQNRRMADAERFGAAIATTEAESSRRELRARVEREYLTLWLLDRRRALNAESRTLADALLRATETQYTVGRALQSDLFRITLEIERLGTELREIDEERAEALGRLNAIVGRPESAPVIVDEDLASAALASLDSLSARVGEHPQLQRMIAMAAMSRAEADAQESMLDPMLMLRGGVSFMPEGHPVREGSEMIDALVAGGEHGATVEPMEDPMHWGITVGAMLSIPLAPWSRSGPEARAEESRLEAEEQLARRDAMERDMVAMLRGAWSDARRARIRLEFHRRTQIPLLEKTLLALRTDYTNGRIPFSQLLDGYTMLVMARMDAYMQEMEYAMALSMMTEIAGENR
jgi:outer membrane protein, heavy metal efflux system